MFKRILLLLCIAYVVICYGFPFFTLPFGEYTFTDSITVAGVTTNYTYIYKFEFGGKGKATIKSGDTSTSKEFTYSFNGNKVKLKENDSGDEYEFTLNNMYEFTSMSLSLKPMTARNDIGMWISVGVGALATILQLVLLHYEFFILILT